MQQVSNFFLRLIPVPVKRSLGRLNIRTKLIVSFVFLLLMMVCAGGAGLFFTSQIKTKVEILSQVASPLNATANHLAKDMLKSHATILYLLSLNDRSGIDAQKQLLGALKTTIDQNMKHLARLAGTQEVNLDIKELEQHLAGFFAKSGNAVLAHENMLEKERLSSDKLTEFDRNRQDLDKRLSLFL